jgi:hypothetical protein
MEITRNLKENHYEFQGTPRNSRGIQRNSRGILRKSAGITMNHEEFCGYPE